MKLIFSQSYSFGEIKGVCMNNLVIVVEKKPVQSGSARNEEGLCRYERPELTPAKGTLTRIISKFEITNPIKQNYSGVIKDYIYVDQKRVLA